MTLGDYWITIALPNEFIGTQTIEFDADSVYLFMFRRTPNKNVSWDTFSIAFSFETFPAARKTTNNLQMFFKLNKSRVEKKQQQRTLEEEAKGVLFINISVMNLPTQWGETSRTSCSLSCKSFQLNASHGDLLNFPYRSPSWREFNAVYPSEFSQLSLSNCLQSSPSPSL